MYGILGRPVPIQISEDLKNRLLYGEIKDGSLNVGLSNTVTQDPYSVRHSTSISTQLIQLTDLVKSVIDEPGAQAVEGSLNIIGGLTELTAAQSAAAASLVVSPATGGISLSGLIVSSALWAKGLVDISSGMDLIRSGLGVDKVNMLENLVGDQNSRLYSITDSAYGTYSGMRELSTAPNSLALGTTIFSALRFLVDSVDHYLE